MHQDSLLNNIFKNVKRKAALQAKEKNNNKVIVNEPIKNIKIENDIIKPTKLKKEKEPLAKENNDNEEFKEKNIPMKRKSTRHKRDSSQGLIEFPKDTDGLSRNKTDKNTLVLCIIHRTCKVHDNIYW